GRPVRGGADRAGRGRPHADQPRRDRADTGGGEGRHAGRDRLRRRDRRGHPAEVPPALTVALPPSACTPHHPTGESTGLPTFGPMGPWGAREAPTMGPLNPHGPTDLPSLSPHGPWPPFPRAGEGQLTSSPSGRGLR